MQGRREKLREMRGREDRKERDGERRRRRGRGEMGDEVVSGVTERW